jgi:hypothetical protein
VRWITGVDFSIEIDICDRFNTEASLVFMMVDYFSSQKQTLLFCVVNVQQGELYISLFNLGVCMRAMSFNHLPMEYFKANANFYGLKCAHTILRDCH